MGRVLLAELPDDQLEEYCTRVQITALTSKSIADVDQLRAEILSVRDAAYATTVDQLDNGNTALAGPARALSGQTIAALNFSSYSGMVTPETLVADRLQDLRIAAGRIEQTIAAHPVLDSIIGG